jgi:hypothetical protein
MEKQVCWRQPLAIKAAVAETTYNSMGYANILGVAAAIVSAACFSQMQNQRAAACATAVACAASCRGQNDNAAGKEKAPRKSAGPWQVDA